MQTDLRQNSGWMTSELEIPDVKLVVPKRFNDPRGYFTETWSDRLFRQEVANFSFVQDNRSVSIKQGTLRGLHFQRPPYAQGKLVCVTRGSVFDVAVDIRRNSPTYGRHVAVRLDATDASQLWVPPGFLHGFCTLEDDTEVFYKVTCYYSPAHDAGVLWSDLDLGIDWPVTAGSVVISEKDGRHPRLRDLRNFFDYEEPVSLNH